MIVAIKGKLESSTLFSAVVEAGGLFYEVNIPLTTAERLPKLGEEVMLYTEAVYREDSQALYGFATKSDRDFFKTIIETDFYEKRLFYGMYKMQKRDDKGKTFYVRRASNSKRNKIRF